MEQWKLILSALMLTLFLPLLLWTGLFAFFGWKLFLFVFLGTGALLLFGEKITKLPLFKSAVRWLLPFAMTARVYRALLAGKEVRDKEGGAVGAWWTTFRRLLQQEFRTQKHSPKASLEPASSPEASLGPASSPENPPEWERMGRESTVPSEQSGAVNVSQSSSSSSMSPRFQPPTEAELEEKLVALKAEMKKKRESEPKP